MSRSNDRQSVYNYGADSPQADISRVIDAGNGFVTVQLKDGSIEKRTGDRASRNYNPGNIRPRGSGALYPGAVGADNTSTNGRMQVFANPQAGIDGIRYNLFNLRENQTLRQAIKAYAPPSENDTEKYIKVVADAAGVSPDTRMGDLTYTQRQKLIAAQMRHEGNTGFNRAPIAAAGTAPENYPVGPNQVPMGVSGYFNNPAINAMATRQAPPRTPTFMLGDRVVTDSPNLVGGGILNAASAIGNFANNIYSRAQDVAPRPAGTVPNYTATTPRGATPPGNFRQSAASPGSGSFTPTDVGSFADVMSSFGGDTLRMGMVEPTDQSWSARPRQITRPSDLVRAGVASSFGGVPSLRDFQAPVPQGDALSRFRQTVGARPPGNFAQSQTAGAPVSPVQRSALPTQRAARPPGNFSQPARTDALSRLRSMAEPSGDMRATPMDTRFAQETQRMDAMAAQPGRRTVVSGQAPQVSTPARPTTPRETVRAFGRSTAEPGFMTSDMARRTPVSVAAAPRAVSGITGTAPGLARAASAPSAVASATGGVLGMIGSGIAGGFNRTLSALGTAPAAPVGVQQAAQVQQAKAVSPQGYTAQTARAARPPGNFAQPARPAGLSSLGSLAAATQSFPKADPNKINTAALQSAAMGAGSGLLSGGIPGAVMGGLVGYATAPNANNPMNATTFGTDQGGFFGGLGSMFSGGGSGRDSTGASFSRGTYSDGPGRGLSYGASASRSGTRSGPTAGRQPGGSK